MHRQTLGELSWSSECPCLAYFALVGSVLLGLLYVAEARLGPPTSLSISTSFHGLPAPFKATASVPILTVRDAPAPDMSHMAVAQPPLVAQTTAKATDKATGNKLAKSGGAQKAKTRKAARQNVNRNLFAHSHAAPRHGGGIVW